MSKNCQSCGAVCNDKDEFCRQCGAALPISQSQQPVFQQQPVPQPQPQQPAGAANVPPQVVPQLGMNWFKFVIYFQLFAMAVLSVINCWSFFSGFLYAREGVDTSLLYSLFPAMSLLDKFVGLLYLGLAVFAIITRIRLANYRENGPRLYLILLGSGIALNVVYTMASVAILTQGAGAGLDVSQDIAQLIGNVLGNLLVIVLNGVYFNKRRHLFVY